MELLLKEDKNILILLFGSNPRKQMQFADADIYMPKKYDYIFIACTVNQ